MAAVAALGVPSYVSVLDAAHATTLAVDKLHIEPLPRACLDIIKNTIEVTTSNALDPLGLFDALGFWVALILSHQEKFGKSPLPDFVYPSPGTTVLYNGAFYKIATSSPCLTTIHYTAKSL